MFDGDPAGERERRDLTSFFGRKDIPFQSNREYVIVRSGFPKEALFPDSWIIDLYRQHSDWFNDIAYDPNISLQSFSMRDLKKSDLQEALKRRAESEEDDLWRSRFDAVAAALNEALEVQLRRLNQDQNL